MWSTGADGPMNVLDRFLRAAAALVAVASLGCASGGGFQSVSETRWREDMGRMNLSTLETGMRKIFVKHGVQEARRQTAGREIYYETRWVTRPVLPTEEALGASNARNRIVVRAHRLEGAMEGGSTFRVTWDVENETTTATNPSWHPSRIPESVVEDFRPVYSDLAMEIRTGLRRE